MTKATGLCKKCSSLCDVDALSSSLAENGSRHSILPFACSANMAFSVFLCFLFMMVVIANVLAVSKENHHDRVYRSSNGVSNRPVLNRAGQRMIALEIGQGAQKFADDWRGWHHGGWRIRQVCHFQPSFYDLLLLNSSSSQHWVMIFCIGFSAVVIFFSFSIMSCHALSRILYGEDIPFQFRRCESIWLTCSRT